MLLHPLNCNDVLMRTCQWRPVLAPFLRRLALHPLPQACHASEAWTHAAHLDLEQPGTVAVVVLATTPRAQLNNETMTGSLVICLPHWWLPCTGCCQGGGVVPLPE